MKLKCWEARRNIKLENIIQTKDFYFACTLMSYNFNLINADGNKNAVYFYFQNYNDEFYKKLNNDYFKGQCFVNTKRFINSMSKLRYELDKFKK